jgi:hypothetical protein
MITGFNTDVKHDGSVYHVQTEARGRDNPVLESLVYIGGTIVAKKMTPYADQLRQGATEDAIAVLLKKQHQVIIAAIRAGRIEDLIRHSTDERPVEKSREKKAKPKGEAHSHTAPIESAPPPSKPAVQADRSPDRAPSARPTPGRYKAPALSASEPLNQVEASQPVVASQPVPVASRKPAGLPTTTGGLNLDEVISDYLKRSSEQGRLDLRVLAPNNFIAGKSIGLRVQVQHERATEVGAIVTIKIIGTAFKPQVYLGRTGHDGVVSFNLALPSFSAGTAAIVIEAQSSHGRGELKHLIRRA